MATRRVFLRSSMLAGVLSACPVCACAEAVRRMALIAFAICPLVALRAGAAGFVHYVPADFETLAEALASDSVVDGDVIQLAQGYHAPTTSASTNYLGEIAKAVTVRGDDNPAKVLLDCGGRGGIVLSHPDAQLYGVTLSNILVNVSAPAVKVNKGLASNLEVVCPANLTLLKGLAVVIGKDGVFADSKVKNVHVRTYSYLIDMSGGKLQRVEIKGCTAYSGMVRAVATDGCRPQIEDCVFNGNESLSYSAMVVTDADVSRCTFLKQSQVTLFGINGSSTFNRCVVTNNAPSRGGASHHMFACASDSRLYMTNCLIAANTMATGRAVNLAAGAKVECCHVTIANNKSTSGVSAGFGGDGTEAKPASVDLRNCVVWNNTVGGSVTNFSASSVNTSYSVTGCCLAEADQFAGEGNIAVDPGFENAARGDYTPSRQSPLIDAAVEVEAVTEDVYGVSRPKADGYVGPDIGCCEAFFPLEIVLTMDKVIDFAPCDVTLAAQIIGTWAHTLSDITWKWKYVRHFNGQDAESEVSTSVPQHTLPWLQVGSYDFICTAIANSPERTQLVTVTNNAFTAGVGTVYVANDGSNEWPYSTRETAARDLNTAMATAGRSVVIAPGRYSFGHAVEAKSGLNCIGAIRSPIRVGGEGKPKDVLIDCGGYGGIVVDHPDAVLCGMTFSNLLVSASAPAVKVVQGVASNIDVMALSVGIKKWPAVSIETEGLLVDSVVRGFYLNDWGSYVIDMAGGEMRRVTVKDCTPYGMPIRAASSNGRRPLINGCTLINNQALSYAAASLSNADVADSCFYSKNARRALFSLSGDISFTRCAITNNAVWDSSAASFACAANSRTCMTNCLVAKNSNTIADACLVKMAGGARMELVNTTLADNTASAGVSGAFGGDGTEASPAVVTLCNSIVWNNLAQGEVVNFAPSMPNTVLTVANCCCNAADLPPGSANVTDDPRFANAAKGDYHLLRRSPCINAGLRCGWRTTDVDMDGKRRAYGRPDLGCYETPYGMGRAVYVR